MTTTSDTTIKPGDLVRYAGDHPGREWRRRAEADCVAYDLYGGVVSASEPLDGSCPGGVGWAVDIDRVRLVAVASWQRLPDLPTPSTGEKE